MPARRAAASDSAGQRPPSLSPECSLQPHVSMSRGVRSCLLPIHHVLRYPPEGKTQDLTLTVGKDRKVSNMDGRWEGLFRTASLLGWPEVRYAIKAHRPVSALSVSAAR